ncbi:hypothetical protein BYT27DRAFT_7251416 [Phlegmacium glaucopus]|nr:hypothetical protein BYT27DRAFT_7251416 [Phlegmacium glaucopus]
MSLPQSPTKKKDERDAVNVFHPAAATNSNISVNQFNTQIMQPKLSQEEDGLSKVDGKKRAIQEDEEVTATDGETSIAKYPSMKKQKQKK